MPPALAARKIDAYIVAEPFNALGELKAGARMLRFTGDIWKNHPCCVVCMHEEVTEKKAAWTQKVMNAVVRGAIYSSENKAEIAGLLSKDGWGYLPAPAEVVTRAMTYYDDEDYTTLGANQNAAEWQNGRIDFQPWPYSRRAIAPLSRGTADASGWNPCPTPSSRPKLLPRRSWASGRLMSRGHGSGRTNTT
jgi:NitT/TauT family transport system substrate-binding protein